MFNFFKKNLQEELDLVEVGMDYLKRGILMYMEKSDISNMKNADISRGLEFHDGYLNKDGVRTQSGHITRQILDILLREGYVTQDSNSRWSLLKDRS